MNLRAILLAMRTGRRFSLANAFLAHCFWLPISIENLRVNAAGSNPANVAFSIFCSPWPQFLVVESGPTFHL